MLFWWTLTVCLGLPVAFEAPSLTSSHAVGQEVESNGSARAGEEPATDPEQRFRTAEQMAEAALAAEPTEGQGGLDDAEMNAVLQDSKINLLDLMVRGGWLMVPIGAMSLLVVAFGAERLLGLRRRKVLPSRLTKELMKMASHQRGFDPGEAYRLCQRFPSSAARIVRAMLLKVGRPHSEVEHAISQASEREAARLYSNVRWLSLAAGVTPLLGLLGTVWGMIDAFFRTSELPVGANKAEFLAGGIYKALVTTFAGLAVAIPAAILAHYFEGRIQKLLHRLDETLLELLPRLERYEGRVRFTTEQLDRPEARPARDAKKPRSAAAPK